MIDALALSITVLSLLTGLVVLVQAGTGRFRRGRVSPTLTLIQLALVVQAAADVLGLGRGHHPREPATHLAYLAVSLVLLPLAAYETRRDDGPWSGVLVAVALVVLAVIVVRLTATWRPAR